MRSLRDVIVTTKHNSRSLVTSTTALGGSTGNLLYDVPRKSPGSSNVRLSTFCSSGDQPQRASHHGQDPDAESGKATGHYYHQPKLSGGSGNVVESPPVTRLTKRFGSTDNLLESRSNHAPAVTLTPPRTNQRGNEKTGMKRFGSEDNLLSETSTRFPVSSSRQPRDHQRLLSDDLPPPPSPSSFVSAETLPPAANVNYANLQEIGRAHV